MTDPGEIRKRVLSIREVSVLPQLAVEIEEAAQDELRSLLNIEELIRSDLSLSAMLLKMANSAYYGHPQGIASVESAVAALGLEEVSLLALGVGAMDPTEFHAVDRSFHMVELWIHSFAVSWIAARLSRAAGIENPEEAASAGLLHDLGKLVLLSHLKPEADLLRRYLSEGRDYYEAESLLGLDHARIGYWLARKWGLPDSISGPIRDHHLSPEEAFPGPLTAFVILANGLAKSYGFGLAHKEKGAPIQAALEAVELDAARIRPVAREAQEKLPRIIERWRRVLYQGGD